MLQRVVVLLIVLNLLSWTTLWYFSKNSDEGPPKKDITKLTELLKEKLELSEKQANHLLQIREDFFRKEEKLGDEIRNKRDSLNEQIFNKEINEVAVDQLARRIAEGEYQMECYRIEQAKQLKALCTPKQLERFQELVLEIRDFFSACEKTESKINHALRQKFQKIIC